MRTINPKSEYLNPKQILNSNAPNYKQNRFGKLGFGKLGFISDLGFSIWNLTLPIAIIITTACLILPQAAQAATYYVDTNNGNDAAGNGDSLLPWKTFSKAQSVIAAGDTVYMTGDFGSIAFNSSSPVGTSDNWITYAKWPGKTDPSFTYISLSGINKSAYIKFDGIRVDPGYVTTSKGIVVSLNNVDYVDFENSYFEGEKVAGAEINSAPFAPYTFRNSSIISSGASSTGKSSYITINNCKFKNSFTGLCITQYPTTTTRLVEHWTITNNEFSDTAEDCITLSCSGYLIISDNYFHDTSQYKDVFYWPGTASGDWSDKQWQTVTQDTTNASGLYYKTVDGYFYIFADDANHLPFRSNMYVWRLDSDPTNTYFTPSKNGDSTHVDEIAFQSATHDTIVERNTFINDATGGQIIKVEAAADNIIFQNNLFISHAYTSAYPLCIAGNNTKLYNNTIVGAVDGPYTIRAISCDLWNSTKSYYTKEVVRYNGLHYISLQPSNLNNIPTDSPAWWEVRDQNVYIYNNIISGAVWSSGGTFYSDYNIWGIAPPENFNEGQDSLKGADLNLLFVDSSKYDFQLKENSAAIDSGNPDYGPATDILGNSRVGIPDAGAYEYGSSSAVTGDINSDSSVDAIDLQLLINMILSGSFDSKADLNSDSSVDAIDLQALVNVILGQ